MLNRICIISSITAFIIFSGCFRKGNEEAGGGITNQTTEITGTLEGGAGKMVMLEEMGAREFIPIDTTICDDHGNFRIRFVTANVAFYVLRYGESGYITLLLEPGETIDFTGNYGKTDTYSVRGSRGSELLTDLAREHKRTLNALGEITRKNREHVSSSGYSEMKPVLDHQFDSITDSFRDYSLDFIHQNKGSLAILVALYNLYGRGLPVFRPEVDLHVYRFVDSSLMLQYSGIEAVGLLHAQISQVEQSLENKPHIEKLRNGEIAPDFVSSRPDGRQMALSDLKGNYVVLNFWAGWSRLSREENQYLRKAQSLYNKQPFRILQVSLDDQRNVWLEAIREDGLDWDHVSDLKRWETIVADLYQVEKIPSSVLIDPQGRIIETDLFGDQLLEQLNTIFSN